jgi:hypothetical protein
MSPNPSAADIGDRDPLETRIAELMAGPDLHHLKQFQQIDTRADK